MDIKILKPIITFDTHRISGIAKKTGYTYVHLKPIITFDTHRIESPVWRSDEGGCPETHHHL